jgi:protein gp37
MATSSIEWTNATWNPVTGCDRTSVGCDNCYALTLAKRLKAMGQPKYQRDGDPRTSGPGFGLTCHEKELATPLRWRKPRRVFVNSMSDLFHPDVPEAFIARVHDTMAIATQHTFQVLTKRPQRMATVLGDLTVLPNVWLGTSVENQRYADLRIPHLLRTPAAVRFLSIEPLLGPVDLSAWMDNLIDWVIIGGESGHGARPMEFDWAATIVEQCTKAGVAVFVKQLGTIAGGTHHHEIDTFPRALRVRQYPVEIDLTTSAA